MKKFAKLSRPFTLIKGRNLKDPLLIGVMNDIQGMNTPLQLMKHYADVLNKSSSYGNIDEKLDKLFLYGRTPESLDGYYHGITLSLKTGIESHGILSEISSRLGLDKIDPLQIFYGRLLSKTSPWAGKHFKKLDKKKLGEMTDGFDKGEETAYLGINSFRKDNKNFMNNLSGYILSAVISMEGVPGPEEKQRSWIYSKGGLFIAKKEKSVDPEHPEKEVIALNYRWNSLGNRFPNKLLIDEIVEIADGLYLGKLYYATALKYISMGYNPIISREEYKYRNFGYFLLMDDSWLHEKNMLFPDLAYSLADNLPQKFTSFHFTDSPECKVKKIDVGEGKTILHYLQTLSRGVREGKESEDQYFAELHKIFLCGERPDGIQGFLHGGVVAFKSSGFLKKLGRNILNELWPVVRPFSPWTGKTFTTSSLEGIRKYIAKEADHYKGMDNIIIGTNTYRKELGLSLPVTAFVEHLDKIGMVVEYPEEKERDEGIYVKSFYFIATHSKSVNPECKRKDVLQFNYRWPEFHTILPDNLCIDELVRIADGLYLGQLLYSTEPGIKYSPETDPAVYKYENFGYFLLMDDEWHSIKDFILFDTKK